MGTIREKLPKKVTFRYPGGIRSGWVIKTTPIEYHKHELGEYATRVELIKRSDGKKAIRFAYYRKNPDDDWTFAGQYTWVAPVDITKKQIERAKSLGLFDDA